METWFDVLVDIDNPVLLDQEVQRFNSVVIQGPDGMYKQRDGHYIVRTMMPKGIQTVIEKERGKVVEILDNLC